MLFKVVWLYLYQRKVNIVILLQDGRHFIILMKGCLSGRIKQYK